MDVQNVPIIKFELDRIRQQIKANLGTAGSELGEMIDKGIESAISSYDFDGKVIMIVHELITEEIDRFFKYGPGKTVVRETVEETLNKAFNPYYESE